MKIIDLIDDIRNKKELPKKIKIKDYVFELNDNFEYKDVYSCEIAYLDGYNYWLRNNKIYDFWLSDEIEIIEEVEDKEYVDIEEIDLGVLNSQSDKNREFKKAINDLIRNQQKIIERLDK